jgi:hypothetical protein
MTDLYPTPTRLALLVRTKREKVRREYDTIADTFVDADIYAGRTVTAVMAGMEQAGWVELDPTRFATGTVGYEVSYWRLTDVGSSVLVDYIRTVS